MAIKSQCQSSHFKNAWHKVRTKQYFNRRPDQRYILDGLTSQTLYPLMIEKLHLRQA